MSQADTTNFIVGCSVIALVWALWNFWIISGTKIGEGVAGDEEKASLNTHSSARSIRLLKEVCSLPFLVPFIHQITLQYPLLPTLPGHGNKVHAAIATGADAFLRAEYGWCIAFEAVFAVGIYSLISWGQNSTLGALTTLAFVLGALTSILSGYIGMKVAVYANARTTIDCAQVCGCAGAAVVVLLSWGRYAFTSSLHHLTHPPNPFLSLPSPSHHSPPHL